MSRLAWIPVIALAAVACSESDALSPDGAVILEAVTPAPDATGVSTTAAPTVRFSRAMAAGATAYLDVHRQGIDGPVVAGSWSWSADRHTATFHPDSPFLPGTRHAIHVGAGVHAADGAMLDFEHCLAYGGEWAAGPGGMHHGEGGTHGDPGWMHGNGSYGMMFVFTTG